MDIESAKAGSGSDKKDGQPKPNYFIAVPINNDVVRTKIKSLQHKMLESVRNTPTFDASGKKVESEVYKDIMTSIDTLHLTLCVVHLKDDREIETAKNILQLIWEKFNNELKGMPMIIKGVAHFDKRVVFARLNDGACVNCLNDLAKDFRDEFNSEGIYTDPKPFVAHITIANLARSDTLKEMNVDQLPEEMWKGSEDEDFGTEKAEVIHLLPWLPEK